MSDAKEYYYELTGNKERKLIFPDFRKLMSDYHDVGEKISIPVNAKDGRLAMWEMGGRHPHAKVSISTLITTDRLTVPKVIVMNKRNKTPNGRQALIEFKVGYRLLVGKLRVGNTLKAIAKFKILQLKFVGYTPIEGRTDLVMGQFVLEKLVVEYDDSITVPMEYLIRKMYTCDVTRPFYVDGWSVSTINADLSWYSEAVNLSSVVNATDHDNLRDLVEQYISEQNNQYLSTVLQVFDLNANMMSFTPLEKFKLSNIQESLKTITVEKTFVCKLDAFCEVSNMLTFECDTINALKLYFNLELGKKIHKVGDNIYVCIRGWKG